MAASTATTRIVSYRPSQGMSANPASRAPRMAPNVFTAYTSPRSATTVSSVRAATASASGNAAPKASAIGSRIAAVSIHSWITTCWKVTCGLATRRATDSTVASTMVAAARARPPVMTTQTARASAGLAQAPGQPGAHRGAAGNAQDEDGHHRAERVGGGPQDGSEEPGPHDLQGQRREAGDAECGGCDARPAGSHDFRHGARALAARAGLGGGSGRHGACAVRRRLPGDPPRAAGGRQVEDDAGQGGAPQPECGQQNESGEERAGGGAQGVGGIEAAGVGRHRAGVPHHPSRGDRKGGAHRGGRHRQQQQARAHAHDAKREPAIAVVVERGQGSAERRQQERQQQRDRGNRGLEDGVGT